MIIHPISRSVCAEVLGFDVRDMTKEAAAELRRALFAYLVVVLRQQKLSLVEQLRLTELFGEPEPSWDRRNTHPDNPYVQMVTNRRNSAAPAKSSSMFWHTDGSFARQPPLVTILAAVRLPSHGSATQYADMRTAFETLPPAVQEQARGLRARHSYAFQLRDLQTSRYSGQDDDELRQFPTVVHPLVRRHPVTGRESLYLNELCLANIEDLAPDADKSLRDRLYAATLVPDNIYQHDWRDGDVLIWDNASLLHRRTAGAPGGGDRVLHRTTCGAQAVVPAAA